MKLPASPKRFLLIAGGVALAAAIYFGWFYAGTGGKAPPPSPSGKEPAVAVRDSPGAPLPAPRTPDQPAMTGPGTAAATITDGDLAIDEVLRSEKEIPAMARDLHGLVRKLSGEAQVNASRHLVNLTSDEDYGLIAEFLVDAKTNPEVIEVLFADLMNRNRELQLPLFLNILRNPQHPENEQVRNVMTILAGEDFANDYAKWDEWVVAELKRLKSES